MELTDLVKDPNKVRKAITVLDDGSVVANRELNVYFPQRFIQNKMAEVIDYVSVLPVLGFVIPDECYMCWTSMLPMRMFPSEMRDVSVKGDKYICMVFREGDIVFENIQASIDPNVPYFYFMEFVNYAKIPWYMDYKAHSSLFDSARSEIGKAVGSSPHVMRVLASIIYRDPDDLEKPYRGSKAMKEGREPVIVGLNNPSMLINDSFSKIMGGYLADNLLSAIIKPADKVSNLDRLIRGIPTDVD